jgi:hypothetical protein
MEVPGTSAARPERVRPRAALDRGSATFVAASALFALSLLTVLLVAAPASAGPCDPPIVNPIVCENSKPGSPASEWDVVGSGSSTIQGFATEISVDQGQAVVFKVSTPSSDYRLDIYRMGFYGGLGARKVAVVQPSASLPQSQPACLSNATTHLLDCGNWAASATWNVPADATSGIYFAKLVREDGTTGSSHVVFIVRDDNGGSDLLFQTSDTTWQAYNRYGGHSLYPVRRTPRATMVSYNRPFTTRTDQSNSWVFDSEYPMVRWLEANGYDVSYSTGVDTDRRGAELLEHEVFLSVGHDEYWSGPQRANVEAARAAGVHLAFFSGNEVFWKTRWEPSISAGSAPYRTLVTYKETHDNAGTDPSPAWTGTWRDWRFGPHDGGRPENALTGTIFTVNCCQVDPPIRISSDEGRMRFWRNTSMASLPPGGSATLPTGVLGYEWDEDLDNGSRPPGLIRMSTTTTSTPSRILDHGSTYGPGTATHSLTLYRHASGALVFGAGTVRWAWGLDANHDTSGPAPDVRMQQATVNLLADMGAQPGTLQPGLVAASASTDGAAPTATFTSPPPASVTSGTPVTIGGTAGDAGGGVVGGVEVSTDNGATWHRAEGRTVWSYTWVPQQPGPTTVRARATDDSGNTQSPGASVPVTVQPRSCPCSIWSNSTVPAVPASTDARAYELGLRFRPLVNGFVTGVRFYKGAGNTGTHTGKLWTNTGVQLATTTFTGETASGWQSQSFSTPVAVQAGTTYVISYFAPVGRFASDDWYFATKGTISWPLEALADYADGRNGINRRNQSRFPTTGAIRSTNYWVDVLFVPA